MEQARQRRFQLVGDIGDEIDVFLRLPLPLLLLQKQPVLQLHHGVLEQDKVVIIDTEAGGGEPAFQKFGQLLVQRLDRLFGQIERRICSIQECPNYPSDFKCLTISTRVD